MCVVRATPQELPLASHATMNYNSHGMGDMFCKLKSRVGQKYLKRTHTLSTLGRLPLICIANDEIAFPICSRRLHLKWWG